MSRQRAAVFVAAITGLVVIVAAALYTVSQTSARQAPRPRLARATTPLRPPFLMFRLLAPEKAYGRVGMVSSGAEDVTWHVTPLSCARVAYASGRGMCLVEEQVGATLVRHVAYVFDGTFSRKHRIELAGVPIRARVAPDGRLASVTTYAEEESPAGERLAMESVLIDLVIGRVTADLREFALDTAGRDIRGPIDISSVAFDDDGDRVYATLATAADRYVVSGSASERRLRVLADGFASEALAPEGQRLVVKKRVGDRGFWQLAILHLPTLTTELLNHQSRSVDDQVEWLDTAHLVYHDATETVTGIWTLAADGQSGPRLLVADAFSPAVVRR